MKIIARTYDTQIERPSSALVLLQLALSKIGFYCCNLTCVKLNLAVIILHDSEGAICVTLRQ